MNEIQKKLDSLQPYVTGIRYMQGIQLVDAVFKDGWLFPESDVIRKEKVDENNYYMFFSEKEGVFIDDLLDYVKSIIDLNIEREKKHELLKEKIKELQILFKDNSLTKLKKLKFTFEDDNIIPSLMDMDIIEEIVEIKEKDVKELNLIEQHEKFSGLKKNKTTTVELPPKSEKIVVESYDIPEDLKSGECKCGPEEACQKCMDAKSLV
jgi:hypothetical protein